MSATAFLKAQLCDDVCEMIDRELHKLRNKDLIREFMAKHTLSGWLLGDQIEPMCWCISCRIPLLSRIYRKRSNKKQMRMITAHYLQCGVISRDQADLMKSYLST